MTRVVGDRAAPFIDDVSTGGQSVAENWGDTLDVLARVTTAGIPVSWRKCQLLSPYLAALGVLVQGDHMQLGVKAIRKLFSTELPTMLAELQRLLGRLNFAG